MKHDRRIRQRPPSLDPSPLVGEGVGGGGRLRADATHGASWLAREALRLARDDVARAPSEDRATLLARVRADLTELRAARPEMAPVRNWLDRLRDEVDRLADEIAEPGELRGAIVRAAERLIGESERAGERAAANAVGLLPAESSIFTASYSQTIRDACLLAAREGKLRRVLAAESAAPNGRRYGLQLAEELAGAVRVEVVPDAEVAARVAAASLVWLGADTVLADGSLLNGTPSLALARAARHAGLPVEVICESAKLDRETPPERADAPPGMDRVPAELIDVVITEDAPAPLAASPRPRVSASVPAEALVARIAEALVARKETLAVVESAAGGRICDLLSDRPGGSAWFAGGMVAYGNRSKEQLAGLAAETLARAGTVSPEVARAMAEGARRLFGASWGIGETGIAGPQTGRRSRKAAGLAYVAVAGPSGEARVVEVNSGQDDRAANKQAFALAALELLIRLLTGAGS